MLQFVLRKMLNKKWLMAALLVGNILLVAFRSYLEDTGTGASYYEVVYDRVMVFDKK